MSESSGGPVRAGPTRLRLGIGGALAAVAVVVALVVLLANRPAGPPGGPVASGPAIGSASEGDFEVKIQSSKTQYAADEPIDITASLTYHGPDASVMIGHGLAASDGPLSFSIDQPVLGDLRIEGLIRTACASTEMQRDVPVTSKFEKSGSFDGSGPRASEYIAFFEDPILRLPSGTWHVRVTTEFSIGGCTRDTISMAASITILVPDASGSVPPPIAPTRTIAPLDMPVGADTQEGPIQLTLTSPHARYRASEPISVTAGLGYWGDEESVITYGSASLGPVAFELHQLDELIDLQTTATEDCLEQLTLPRNERLDIPFSKAGLGTPRAGDDFWDSWMDDPELRLPAGTWEIAATPAFSLAEDCSVPGPAIRPSMTIFVEP